MLPNDVVMTTPGGDVDDLAVVDRTTQQQQQHHQHTFTSEARCSRPTSEDSNDIQLAKATHMTNTIITQDGHHWGTDGHHWGVDGHHWGADGHHWGADGHHWGVDGHHWG